MVRFSFFLFPVVKNAMKNVYYSLIYSHIIYAIEVWGSAFNRDLEKILILQKKSTKTINL